MTGMFAQVQVGQKVSLVELENGFELALLPAEQPGPVVMEVTANYIIMEDAGGEVTTRVPTYLIKSIRTVVPEVIPSAA